MKVNARTEKFQHIEVFDKPALFTNGRIARDTVPKGWYCYDIRGSDDDPGELCYMEENVVVNHAGSVLMPKKLAMPKSGRLDVRDELGFLDEGDMTLREFCEAHQLPYPAENMKFHIRPARPEEAGLFYTPHPEEDKRLGTVGHVRMDFGRSGNEFWHTWWPRGPEELNSPAFKLELQEVVDTLRESVLKSRFAISSSIAASQEMWWRTLPRPDFCMKMPSITTPCLLARIQMVSPTTPISAVPTATGKPFA